MIFHGCRVPEGGGVVHKWVLLKPPLARRGTLNAGTRKRVGGGEWSGVTGNMLTNLTNHKMPPMVPTKRPHQEGSSNRGSGALGQRPIAGRRGGRSGCNPAPSYPCRGGSMGGRERRHGGGGGGGGGGCV